MKKLICALAVTIASVTGALAEGVTHYLAIHVDENDPAVMNMALNNAANVTSYYASQGDEVVIELVAYGPGLVMYIPGKSPVADRIATMSLELSGMRASGHPQLKRNERALATTKAHLDSMKAELDLSTP